MIILLCLALLLSTGLIMWALNVILSNNPKTTNNEKSWALVTLVVMTIVVTILVMSAAAADGTQPSVRLLRHF